MDAFGRRAVTDGESVRITTGGILVAEALHDLRMLAASLRASPAGSE